MWFMVSDGYSMGREWQLWQHFRACLMDEFHGERMFRNVSFFMMRSFFIWQKITQNLWSVLKGLKWSLWRVIMVK